MLLSGHLGSGKTAIARGIIRAFCGDPSMFVPSPTFLLNLSYQEDTAHELSQQQQLDQQQQQHANGDVAMQDQQQQQQKVGSSIHHMDPYRLGTTDKMAGLIDFESAFQQDVCVIEWASKMPSSVMTLPRNRTIEINIAGSGAQAAGRLVHIRCSQEDVQAQSDAAAAGSSGPCAELLLRWRQQGLPKPQVVWKNNSSSNAAGLSGQQQQQGLAAAAAAGLVPAGDPAEWLVLGIESSCDDTAAAVVRGDGKVLAHRVASQV